MTSRTWPVVAVAAALALGAGATLASGHGGGGGEPTAHASDYKPRHARALFAVLLGRNELAGDPLRRGAGDLGGRGAANVTIEGTTVCFGITVADLSSEPVAAHIHRGTRRQNGPVVVTLAPPDGADPGASSGCVEDVPRALARAIRRHPRRYYVNVHTEEFPGGAVRGQLFGRRR